MTIPPLKIKEVVEEVKDWIETCLDGDAHGKWHRAPNFQIIEDVAELMAPRIVDRQCASCVISVGEHITRIRHLWIKYIKSF